MQTIKIYNLEQIGGKSRNGGQTLSKDEFSLYIRYKEDGKFGTHVLSFSEELEFYKQNKMYFTVGENKITGELYFIFKEEKEDRYIKLYKRAQGARVVTSQNNVVRFVARKLQLKFDKSINVTFKMTRNLSKSEHIITYKVLGEKK